MASRSFQFHRWCHCSVNCPLLKLSPSAFFRRRTYLSFARWPIIGASRFSGRELQSLYLNLLVFSSSVVFLSRILFWCAGMYTNAYHLFILLRNEGASEMRLNAQKGCWASSFSTFIRDEVGTWAWTLKGFLCNFTSKHFHFLQRWALWCHGNISRELVTRSLARSFSVVHLRIIQRQLFWKAKILDFYQRGVFDFILVGGGQVNQECICPKRLRQKCNHTHVSKMMEELIKVILGRGSGEVLSGKERVQQMSNICLESYL